MDTTHSHPVEQISFDQMTAKVQHDLNRNLSDKVVDPECDPKAEIAIQQLRDALKDCKLHDSSDEYLLKWVSVYGYDVARAEKMLRQSLEWRRANGVDTILESYTPCRVLKKYHSRGQIGVDKFGCPLFMHAFGRTDFRGLVMSVSKKEARNFNHWCLEHYVHTARMETQRTGKLITRATYIFDYDGFSLRTLTCKPALDFLLETTKCLYQYYPDSSRRLFIINAPSFFPLIFSLIKPFLHESDVPKIKIFGSDKKEWTCALLEEIEADQLPAFYGGTMTDPDGDPKCPSKFNMGGKVPSSYYMNNNAPVAKDYMETINIVAGVGGRKKLNYNVDIAQSVLRWEFMTEGGDIGFRIYSKKDEDLVPHCRVDSHLLMEEGCIICDQPGKYVVQFDNTYSYLRTKKLRYRIVIDPPPNRNSSDI